MPIRACRDIAPTLLRAALMPLGMLTFFGCGEMQGAAVESVGDRRDTTVVTDDGVRLHASILGGGPDTVVVPLEYWNQAAFEGLARERTFVFYDPRGRRESDPVENPAEYGIEQDLRDLETVRDELGLGRFSLIGTSYYGALAARYAMLHPDRVERLVLVGSLYPRRRPHIGYEPPDDPTRKDPEAASRLERMREEGRDTLDPEAFCRAYWAVEGPSTVGDPAAAARRTYPCDLPNEWPTNTSAWGSAVFRSLGDWDWRSDARKLKTPTLVIHGELDRMVPRASSEEWARILPNGWFHELPGAGHVPWWEHEESVFQLVDGFLDGRVPAASRQVVDESFLVTEPEWSRDGGRIVFAGGAWPDLDVYVLDVTSGRAEAVFVGDSTEYMPSWSPDGERVVFASTRSGSHDLYVGPAAGDDPTRITRDDGCDSTEPRWSPTGEWIAFRSDCDGNREVYRIRPDGTELTRLTRESAEDGEPSWSPDGSRLLFTSERDGQPEVYVMNADGSDPRRLTTTPEGYSRRAEWSPDGEWIAFGTNRDGNDEVYLMRADGSEARNVTRHPAREYYSRWSPDGALIAFTSNRDRGANAIYTTTPAGDVVVRVFPPGDGG